MAILNGVPFRQVLVSQSKWSIKAPYTMSPKKLTLHETDNMMPAINEINYMNSNNNLTSYHIAVDEKEAVQGLPFNRNGWHAGDGGNGYGNRNTIAMEICRNYDRDRATTNLLQPLSGQYNKAVANAIKVGAQILINQGIVANNENIKTHNDWNGKHCPRKMRNDGKVQIVKAGIIAEYNRLKGLPAPKPAKPTATKKADGHLSLSQVVDKTIAGGYGSQPQREKNINSKTSFTYKQVQDAVNAKLKGTAKPKPASKPQPSKSTSGKKTLHLPASAKTWRIYNVNGPYKAGKEIHFLTPSAFPNGITYDILEEKGGHVYIINTGVKGRVAIYAGPETGAKIVGSKAPIAKPAPKPVAPKAKRVYLPASAKLWRVYKPNGPYVANGPGEIHKLTPSVYGGLDYEIKGNPAPHVYLIDTGVKGRVAIYAGSGTGATIK